MSDVIPSSPAPGGEFLFYQTEDGRTRLQVRVQDETVWLSLNQLAELFQRDKSVVSRHISNVVDEGELVRERVVANYATTATDGKTYKAEFFNLDVISLNNLVSCFDPGWERPRFNSNSRAERQKAAALSPARPPS